MKKISGKTALVTGASGGIGAEFARDLSRAGCNLVLTARRKDHLQVLKEELEKSHGIRVDVIPADLSTSQGRDDLIRAIDIKKIIIDILINNAGFGYDGDFISQSSERLEEMIALNITALTFLSKHFAGKMATRKSGYILLTSSVGGLTPCPGMAVYDATKAYVLILGEALSHELRKHNVTVTTLCPGATRTDFFSVSGQTLNSLVDLTMMNPRDVAIQGIKGLLKGRSHVMPGLLNRLAVLSLRLVPRALMASMADRVMH